MNKRRLSKQQQRRINEQRTLAAGESAEVAAAQCNGRVISHFGQQLDVESTTADASENPLIVRCHQRANLPALVTGDLVKWEPGEDGSGVVTAVADRRNVFLRPDSMGRDKPVAANLDVVLVVIACVPEPFVNLIDRYLVAIENLGLRAALVLNKTDLLTDSQADITGIMDLYRGLDYPVFEVSAKTSDGMASLQEFLGGLTTVLVGQSGVGKSSLVNSLGGQEASESAEVGELSVGKDKGTHTTTTARLFHLPNCDLIDSPGIREFSLAPLSPEQVCNGFPELRRLLGDCKFRNCSHRGDPGCALIAAAEAGDIDARRWSSFNQILASNES
jgi:ribosome biogenesis GTPase